MTLLSTSGTLAGLSMALVSMTNLKIASTKVQTVADDMFLFSSLGFLLVCYLVFFTLRNIRSSSLQYWINLIDMIFLASLTLLVLAGFVLVYEFL
jgi:hypothetical protein